MDDCALALWYGQYCRANVDMYVDQNIGDQKLHVYADCSQVGNSLGRKLEASRCQSHHELPTPIIIDTVSV